MMTLHTVAGSPSGRKVETVINHLGIDVRIQLYDLFKGELHLPAYLALNPNAQVPTLQDGDFVLWESNAIMQYLAERVGDERLFPRDPQRRADVTRWQCWEAAHFNKAFGTLAFETVAKPRNNAGTPDETLVKQACAQLARYAPVLDQHMAKRRFVVGAGITLADYSVIQLEGYRALVPFDWAPYRNLNAYMDRMHTVDAWQRVWSASADQRSSVA